MIAWTPARSVGAQSTEAPSGVSTQADPLVPAREETYQTPRGYGMGMGSRAAATGTTALAYNPANLALGKLYHVEATTQVVTGDNSWALGSAVVDSAASKLALGTSFRGLIGNGVRQYRGWDWRSAIGLALLEQLSVGTAVRWANIKPRKKNGQPLGPRFKGITMDAAARASPVPWLHIAALGYNLIRTGSDHAPQTVGGSLSLKFGGEFEVGTDLLADLTTFDKPELMAGAGFEYVAKKQVQLRVGYRRDGGREINTLTTGIGYVSRKVSTDFSVLQELNKVKETQLIFAVRYHVQ